MIFLWTAGVCLLLLLVYLFCIWPGRRPIPENLRVNYAHRGLHDGITPENSLAAFRRAVEAGYGIELDVQLSADGEVVVFHDSTLDRMTEGQGKVSDHTLDQLRALHLAGTEERIPTLTEVLALVDGKVPMLVELKGESLNAALCPMADEILSGYTGPYLVESFNPMLLRWYKKNRPAVLRGQLTMDLFRENGPTARNFLLDTLLLNVLTRPDFLAYDIRSPKRFPVRLCTGLLGAGKFVWTIRTDTEYEQARALGAGAIFENCTPPVQAGI